MVFKLEALGGLRLVGADGQVVQAQRRRLALLALLAAAGERGMTRDQLVGCLWPDATEEHARHALNQLVYSIRRSLSEDALRGADPVRLDPGVVDSDVRRFEAALSAGAHAEAVAQYRGPFLDGFYLPDAPAFECRVEGQRARLAAAYADALDRLAAEAERRGDAAAAVTWRRTLAELDRLDARRATALMRALVAAGDSTGAVAHGRTYEALVRGELDAPADPSVIALASEIRARATRQPKRADAAAPPIVAAAPSAPEARTPAAGSELTHGGARAVVGSPALRRRVLAFGLGALTLATALFGARELRDNRDASAAVLVGRDRGRSNAPRYTPSIDAYEWYLRGMDPTLVRRVAGGELALEYFNKAIAADSNFAAAYAGLALKYVYDAGDVPGNQREAYTRAEQAARKAVALDDSLAEAHVALGWARQVQWDWTGAEAELKRAIALDPRAPRAFEGLARVYVWTGPPAAHLAAARTAMELDPFSHSAIREMAIALSMNGRCDEAIDLLGPLKTLSPAAGVAGVVRGQCFAAMQMWPEAIAEFRWAMEQSSARTALSFLGYALARAGQRDEAQSILSDLLAGRTYSHGAFGIATVYAGLRDFDEAFAWLDKAVDENSVRVYLMGPMFEDLRRDPRFARVKRRLGL